MKIPFGFAGKGKKSEPQQSFRNEWNSVSAADDFDYDFSDEEYEEESFEEADDASEEFPEDAYPDEEFDPDIYETTEFAPEDVAVLVAAGAQEEPDGSEEAEPMDGEYPEGEYVSEDGEYPEEEYISEDGEYPEEEYSSEDGEYPEEEYMTEAPEDSFVPVYMEGEYAEGEYIPEDGEYPEGEYIPEDGEYPEGEYAGEENADDLNTETPEQEEYIEETEEIEDIEDTDDFEYDDEEDEDEGGLIPFLGGAGLVDKLIMFGGVAILLLALIVGGFMIGTKALNRQEDTGVTEVGKQLAQIETIGRDGLLAVSDAQRAALEAAKIVEEEVEESSEEYEEEEYATEVTVKLSMSSIEKDLKIKFVNKDTGKLIGNVPFSISVKDPNGKTSMWSDDDMDGIIYKKNLTAGQYEVTVNDFDDEKYKKYELPSGSQKVEVKAQIVYEKVDVSNEVKSETQVDVQKEDTKKNETVVEGYLADTVPWVESTTTLVTYTEVAKTNIADPLLLALNTTFVRLSAGTDVSGNTTEPTPTPEATVTPEPTQSPEATATPEPTQSPEATATPEPTQSPEATATPEPTQSPEATATPTPTPSPMVITLDKKTATAYVDHTTEITVSVENLMENAQITAVSSDTTVAKAEVKDKTVTVTGVKEGSVTITVKCTAEVKVTEVNAEGKTVESAQTYEASPVVCTVEVKADPKKDTKTVLKDKEDREVYVKDGTEYRQAYYADYYTYDKFYVKGEALYTGWQTLDGKRYYFDANGDYVTGEQVIQGVKYNFASDGTLVTGSGTLGIDVSKWNGNIDWTAVKNSGVSYVIIRCGYRGSSEGALIKDSKFETNIKGAINAGLKVGVYFFTQAIDKNEAVEEASMVLECIRNYKISYPVFLDVEASGGRADSLDKATRTEICKAFCETIKNSGYTAGIYANKNWLTEKINTSELSSSYKIWLAQYASAPTYTGRYDMWQYKSTGKISGISGDVDMNLSYLGY